MPLFDFECTCGKIKEVYTYDLNKVVTCDCGLQMERQYTGFPMVKMKGEGGYPSRRRQIFNTTSRNHPPLKHDPKRIYI